MLPPNPLALRAARALILAHHEQADNSPHLRHRRDDYRTALACIELVQAAAAAVELPSAPARAPGLVSALRRLDAPAPEAVPDTVQGDYSKTMYAGRSVRGDTELLTLVEPLRGRP